MPRVGILQNPLAPTTLGAESIDIHQGELNQQAFINAFGQYVLPALRR